MLNMFNSLNRGGIAGGFTLIETLMAVAILGGVMAIGIPLLYRADARNNAIMAETVLVGYLRRASEMSRSGANDSQWGVRASSTAITLFRGNSYNTREVSDDTVFMLYGGVTATGTDIVFNKVTGFPVASSTHILKQVGGLTRTVHTNPVSTVSVTRSL